MGKNDFDENDIKTLRRLTSILNGGELTQKEFVDAFEQVVQIVLNVQNKIIGNNNAAQQQLNLSFEELKASNKTDIGEFIKKATALCDKAISDMKSDAEKRLHAMETTVSLLEDGKDADEEMMIARLKEIIPTVEDIVQYLPQAGTSIRDALELLQGSQRLKPSAIDGWEELQAQLIAAQKKGTPIQLRGGGTRGFYVYIGGVKKGIINTLDFVAGTGMSIAFSKVNGRETLTFNATGGGGSGVTVETPPEPPNAVTTVFTVSAQPQWIVADGTTYYEGAGYTYAALQVTMDVAPSSFIRAII